MRADSTPEHAPRETPPPPLLKPHRTSAPSALSDIAQLWEASPPACGPTHPKQCRASLNAVLADEVASCDLEANVERAQPFACRRIFTGVAPGNILTRSRQHQCAYLACMHVPIRGFQVRCEAKASGRFRCFAALPLHVVPHACSSRLRKLPKHCQLLFQLPFSLLRYLHGPCVNPTACIMVLHLQNHAVPLK